MPPLLRQVIGARVARLGAETGRLLAVAAVIGQEVPLDLWAARGEADEEALADAVERAVAARLLAETPDGPGVRFAHALIREALYEGIPPAPAAGAAPPRGRGAAGDRRPRSRRGGLPPAAGGRPARGRVADRGRERAQRAYAWLTAAERYEAALALLGGHAPRRARLVLLISRRLRYLDDARRHRAGWKRRRAWPATGDGALAASARSSSGSIAAPSATTGRGCGR